VKNTILYILTFAVFVIGLWQVVKRGDQLPVKPVQVQAVGQTLLPQKEVSKVAVPLNSISQAFNQFKQNIKLPLSLLLSQILLIILVSRIFSMLLTRIGQQTVIGEIIAGIVLGPSVMGLLFPHFFQFIFPADSLKTLQFLSQIGLAFFMFIIGMDLDLEIIKKKAQDAVLVSNVSVVFPFLLGTILAYYLYEPYAPAGVSFLPFCLFIGISVSITAFPVLARILQERGMTRTPMGALAIVCAATDDVTAWCILAVVIAIAKAGAITSALFTIILAILFVLGMLFVVKPVLLRISRERLKKESPDKLAVAVAFFTLLGSAYTAELIGIHALFGSFLAGVIMPNNLMFKQKITEKIEDVSVMVLLPIFFAFTGLRTQIGLLNEGHAWIAFGYILAVAVVGKFGGSAFSAKFVGQSWKSAFTIGALMNTRGLMELIVLNIGYDLGILSPQIFAMMVLMALVTTFMTGPSLDLIGWISKKRNPSLPPETSSTRAA
jgi:Kef-type K+ transport system membrane component KefB